MKRFDLPGRNLVVLLPRPTSRIALAAGLGGLGLLGVVLAVAGATRNGVGSTAIVGLAAFVMIGFAAAVPWFACVVVRNGEFRTARTHGWISTNEIREVRVDRDGHNEWVVVDTPSGVRRLWTPGASVLDSLVGDSFGANDLVRELKALLSK